MAYIFGNVETSGGGLFEGIDRATLKKLKKGKGIALFFHARKRCRERYSLNLDWKTYDKFCRMIRNLGTNKPCPPGAISRLGAQSNSRSLWKLKYEGRWYTVVYNNTCNLITTFLPEGATPYGFDEVVE